MGVSWSLPDRVPTSLGCVAAGVAGEGPPLVLAHGWPWSSFAWHRVLPELGRHYRCHWYDMPGYGASEKDPARPNHLGAQGGVFCEMLDHWGLERPSVIAHDMGGAVSLRAHLLHGRDFAGCALMNVVAMRPWGSAFFEHVGRHVEAFTGLPPHIHRAVVSAYIEGALVRSLAEGDLDALCAPWLDAEGRASFYKQFAEADEAFTAELEPLFGALRCRATVLWGAEDPWIPIARGRALHAALPDANFRLLEGLGHLPQLEDPEPVAQALLEGLEPAA